MNICDQCDLPRKICTALALYRRAQKHVENGRNTEALGLMKEADEHYREYYYNERSA